ncbi:MAG: hypothetical protein M3O22_07280 [Pseudomonadota bacterium]|nr:hypothetical protein [Pseudomonadota bacterium]
MANPRESKMLSREDTEQLLHTGLTEDEIRAADEVLSEKKRVLKNPCRAIVNLWETSRNLKTWLEISLSLERYIALACGLNDTHLFTMPSSVATGRFTLTDFLVAHPDVFCNSLQHFLLLRVCASSEGGSISFPDLKLRTSHSSWLQGLVLKEQQPLSPEEAMVCRTRARENFHRAFSGNGPFEPAVFREAFAALLRDLPLLDGEGWGDLFPRGATAARAVNPDPRPVP